MFRLVLFMIGFLASSWLGAQSPNQWIDLTRNYYKVSVARNGIYRITYDQLQQSGFPVESVNPENLQLFHRGLEHAIYVEGEADGKFDAGDFIEFYGRKNDGASDTPLYENSNDQAHTHYNLFTDSSAFFLTEALAPGKRMAFQLREDGASLPEESYHLAERLLLFTDEYAMGESDRDEFYSSAFQGGEGWVSTPVRQGQSRDFVVSNIVKSVASGPLPKLEVFLVGRNAITHTVEIRAGSAQRLVASVSPAPYQPFTFSQDIAWTDISATGDLPVRISVPARGYNDQVSVAGIRVTFPQETDAFGQSEAIFTFPPGDRKNLGVRNVAPGTMLYDVTDAAGVFRYETESGGSLYATLPPSGVPRSLHASAAFHTPARITRVVFRDFRSVEPEYVIITHPLLRRPAGGHDDPVKAYAAYRASDAGGSFDTLIVNIQQLYDQFNFGEASPLAVYRFLEFISQAKHPSYLFLVGKGLEFSQKYHRSASSGNWEQQDLVPTGGAPGSDAAFSMGLRGQSYESIPTGRLPAMTAMDVAFYLEKVQETEAGPFDGLWRKKILHLSGGVEEWEPAAFKAYLEVYQNIAEGPYLGGLVDAIAKQSRDIQTINIAEQVNSGVGLITFFGHSSATTLDFDIGFVTNKVMGYNNRGKYPVMLMNGCEVGAFFLRRKLFGEDWILAEKLGATGFLAHNAFAGTTNLYNYSLSFYNVAYADSLYLNKGIGDIKLETARVFMSNAATNIRNRSQVEQMILLGDPAVKLFYSSKPDLEIDEDGISFIPFGDDKITALADSFALRFVVRNYGMATDQLYRVEVERVLPDNVSLFYDSIFTVPRNADTLTMIIRRGREDAAGNNVLRVKLDPDGIIEEMSESNNSAEAELVIPGNGTKNLYPSHSAIVNTPDVRLSFQATNLFSGKREFVVQLDTVNTFDSPEFREFEVTADVLASLPVTLPESDTLAWYWRTRIAVPLEGESSDWEESTFTYIKDSPEGWAQVHFPQLISAAAEGLSLDSGSRRISFQKTTTSVDIVTFGSASGKPRDSVSVKISGQEYNLYTQGVGCRMNTINLIAFDRKSTTPYIGVDLKWYEILYQYGGRRLLCGRQPFVINSFTYNETYTGTGTVGIPDYVNNISPGDSVILFTIGNANIPLWPATAKSKVGELGISLQQLSQIKAGEPVVILARKGAPPGSAEVIRLPEPDQLSGRLVVNSTVSGGYSSGALTSALIGPASSWEAFYYHASEIEPQDVVRIEIRGITPQRDEIILFETAANAQDLSMVDPLQYPFLRVIFHTADDLLLTPSQLNDWVVRYTPVAEGVLLPLQWEEGQETLIEGSDIDRNFRFVNITEKAFPDSLTVQSRFFNAFSGQRDNVKQKIRSPQPHDTTFFSISRNTKNHAGWNDLEVFVNPRIVPEQLYDNNYVNLRNTVRVIADEFAPVTEVTFDGKFIQNGEYVAPNPLIRISVHDENPYLLKVDTSGTVIQLKRPCANEECVPQRIWFSRADVSWEAATAEKPFVVQFRPALNEGTHILTVESSDVKQNKSSEPHSISFEVKDESVVSLLQPHPNPFSGEVTLGFILSGGILPEKSQLVISDITGRTVYSSTKENGFSIGRNIFFWNGVDSNGGYLKSGVYLFALRVYINNNIETRTGKIVLHR